MDTGPLPGALARGLRALENANAAFAQLPGEALDAIAARAVQQARVVLGVTPIITLNRVGVSRTLTMKASTFAPSLTATLASTPS